MLCPRCEFQNSETAEVCDRCGLPRGVTWNTDLIRAQLKVWQERLLDLTRANPLLGINRSRVSRLRVVEPAAPAIFRDLVVEDRALRMPRVVKVPRTTQPVELSDSQPDTETESEYRIELGDLVFEGRPAELHRKLRRIYDNARTTIEERGVTTLHLSVGVLRWSDPYLEESISPLWLVPCDLESFGPSAPFKLSRADEEMQLNPALELYLRERHRLPLPAVRDENPTWDTLAAFFEEVRAAVREHGWKVEPEVWLSTYTFESLVLYQDLRALVGVAIRNPIVAHLARATQSPEASEALGEEAFDTALAPDQIPLPVLPTDSSQLKALTVARAQRHLVVHGPPGTGKSQTIANLIAGAIGQGKTVLFVSAKMAALDVVHARLTRLGLERFCLEAHSTKAGKAKIIEELRRTLAAAERALPTDRLDNRLEDLLRVRTELNAYVRALHERREPLGLSVYGAIGQVERLTQAADVTGPLPWSDPSTVTRNELHAALDTLDDLGAQAEVYDERGSHPWRGLAIELGRPVVVDGLVGDLTVIRAAYHGLEAELNPIETILGQPAAAATLESLQSLAVALAEMSKVDRLPREWAARDIAELESAARFLEEAATNADERRSGLAQHDAVLDLRVEPALALLAPVDSQFQGRTRLILPAYWRWRSAVRPHLKAGSAWSFTALRAYFGRAKRISELTAWFDTHRSTLGAELGGDPITDPIRLREAAHRLAAAARFRHALLQAGWMPPSTSPPLTVTAQRHAAAVAQAVNDSALARAIGRVELAWPSGLIDGLSPLKASLKATLVRLEDILSAPERAHEWIVLQHTLQRCRELGLGGFVDSLGATSARAARNALERRFYAAWAQVALGSQPELALFTGGRREEQIGRFRDLDQKLRHSTLARIKADASEPARRIATARVDAGTAGEVGILRKELERQRRFKPLRKLFAEIPNVLRALKPCMLMSPLSVSTFLKPDGIAFDLVVFDEASQLPTPEGMPAVLRGRQVVVAGDSKQLPPSSFFAASAIFEDGPEGADAPTDLDPLESLLDDCVAIFPAFDQAHLRWHYRSRDERLIKFSNHAFYRERPLITFPSVSTSTADRGVRYELVEDGVWDRGGSRTNRAEARRVAELVLEHLERRPERSLGVAAMNVTQREAIEEALDERLLGRSDLMARLQANQNEPFFIKALENIQGDERDTILISVGYAKTASGALAYNFGPLNQDGGWRRLNVLVTRARWQTILVTSLHSHELAGVNPQNRGAVALRDFIAYAERRGELPPAAAVLTDEETNDFEDAVAEALRARGFQVDQQVGASEYRIDLAVRDPRDPHRYLLAVECDGATYHSAQTARDRDLLREQVLREQGWRVHRVWSTDWFRDREKATQRVLQAIERAQEEPVERGPVAPPRSPASETSDPVVMDTETARVQATRAGDADNVSVPGRGRYRPGTPYRKHLEQGRRELLLEWNRDQALAAQIARIVETEGPIHREFLVDRLKDINGVARVGPNVQTNINRAIDRALRLGQVETLSQVFLTAKGRAVAVFRHHADDVERRLAWIPPDEIALAVLYIVEDQYGCRREVLPRLVASLFGFERAPAGVAEAVGSVVDDLIERGALTAGGPHVHLA